MRLIEIEMADRDSRRGGRGRSLPDTGYTDAFVAIYRAVPVGVLEITPMDYVSRSRKFAIGHADHMAVVEGEDFHVLRAIVKAGDVYEAYNPGEYFYDGPAVRARSIHVAET